MKTLKPLWILIAIGMSLAVFWHYKATPKSKENQRVATSIDSNAPTNSDNARQTITAFQSSPHPNPAVFVDDAMSSTSKDEFLKDTLKNANRKPQDFYGQVIDQDGNAIVGVEVTGNLRSMGGLGDDANSQTYKTRSDANGLFQFTGIKGWQLGVTVKKEGYLMGERGEGFQAAPGGKMAPYNRAILTMWKLHEPERLVTSSINSKIPNDGTSVAFNIDKGESSMNGDLRVTLSQVPLDVKNGRERFGWDVKVEILDGGLMEENDPYPYWAPTNGYQSAFEFNMSSNAVKWLPNLKKDFYIKTAQGQYGRMRFEIYPGRLPTGIQANFIINPSGSQNLEPFLRSN